MSLPAKKCLATQSIKSVLALLFNLEWHTVGCTQKFWLVWIRRII